ncbi:MAG TPA: UDP-2,3-diacylglucosamine diphosphatase [Cyclobacteriaceae bacterium]|nr:UDP-2,3-diacylglucosamine diphosphatase [Cyclobacteriaceae bacterium]
MIDLSLSVPENKRVYFASDFHLGSPSHSVSLEREKKVVRWLNSIMHDAHSLFILGDIFDFWFEYGHTIPKGYARLMGCLAGLRDAGIGIYFFTGNHDMWMQDYFPKEFGIRVFRKPATVEINGTRFLLGHGDGLGPGDFKYKVLKKIFENKICQWAFRCIHPDLGIPLANFLSRNSRDVNLKKDLEFLGDKEWILQFCREAELKDHHDIYMFGHRHMPLDININENSRYINLGDWMNHFTYAVTESKKTYIVKFDTSMASGQ